MAAVEVRQLPGRGNGLVATRPIAAGEAILSESPLMLTPSRQLAHAVCSNCLRALPAAGGVTCSVCGLARFCGDACTRQAAARPEGHSPWLCRSLARVPWDQLTAERQDALHFLVQATALRAASAGDPGAARRFAALQSLCGAPVAAAEAAEMHSVLARAVGPELASLGVGPAEVGALMGKEECNAFGVMAPSGPGGERRVRGSALYVLAALCNHDCLPCAARFDYFDGPAAAGSSGGGDENGAYPPNTTVHLRALSALPAGEELTVSYFPLHLPFKERQARCRDQYGFECMCLRCQEEGTWASDDDFELGPAPDGGGEVEMEGSEWGSESAGATQGVGTSGGDSDGPGGVDADYISVFLLKYVCAQPDCFGSLAPRPGDSGCFECNMCGSLRSEAQFLALLQEEGDGM